MRFVAIITAKANSSRLPKKNFREFHGGKSLVEIKAEQCRDSGVFDTVYISSDAPEAKDIAARTDAVFYLRDERYCIDETPYSEVLENILLSIPEDNDTVVAICFPTNPLFTRYSDAVSLLKASPDRDSVVAATKLQHYFLNADFIPLNFQFGIWHAYSQNIKPIYHMNCALWMAPKEVMLTNRYYIGVRPVYLQTTMAEGLDIDTFEEFEMAQLLFNHYDGKPPPPEDCR